MTARTVHDVTEVYRLDVGRLDAAERTPQGGLRVPAYLTRVGVFEYQTTDGKTIRELRPAEEVFSEDSLASLRGAPVTDLHPSEMVRTDTWRDLARGNVGDDVRADARFVAATLYIQDGNLVDAVERGDRREISCGYTCQVEESSGVFDGQSYDRIQRRIRYNHAALGPRNWGRAGSDVALRLDASGNAIAPDVSGRAEGTPMGEPTKVERIDGVEYVVDSDQHKAVVSLRAERDKAQARADAADAEVKSTKDLLATEKKRQDGLAADFVAELIDLLGTAQKAGLEPDGDEMMDEEEAPAEEEATDSKTKVRRFNVDKARRAVIAKVNPEVKLDGKSPEYLRAAYDFAKARLDSKPAEELLRVVEQPRVDDRTDSGPSLFDTFRANAIGALGRKHLVKESA